MPVYEYECQSCKKVFEKQQKMSEAPLATCESCGGPVKKLMSVSSFQLKGGGWYADGYASCGADKCAGAGSGDAAPSCAGGGSCCASCPAAS